MGRGGWNPLLIHDMNKYTKDRATLLDAVLELVNDTLMREYDYRPINEKRYKRKLKDIRKALDVWIKEMKDGKETK